MLAGFDASLVERLTKEAVLAMRVFVWTRMHYPYDAHHRDLLHSHFPKIASSRRGQQLQAWYVEARSFAHNVAKPEAGLRRCCHDLVDVTDTHGALSS